MEEMVGFRHVIWFVMIESAKDRVLGVDTLEQQVMPHVRYGMACLLIRGIAGSVPCSDVWKIGVVTRQAHTVQEGPWYHSYPRKP
jgi:hypothetical protein